MVHRDFGRLGAAKMVDRLGSPPASQVPRSVTVLRTFLRDRVDRAIERLGGRPADDEHLSGGNTGPHRRPPSETAPLPGPCPRTRQPSLPAYKSRRISTTGPARPSWPPTTAVWVILTYVRFSKADGSSMDVTAPATVVLSPGMAAVLRALCGADAAFTVRQLARVAGVSHARTAEIVNRLAEHGLVLVDEYGAGKLCRLNRDHLAAGAVCDLTQMRSRLLGLLRDTISGWAVPPLHASLFGSAARGDGDVRSDLDVLLVRPDGITADHERWDDQLLTAGQTLQRATGNNVAFLNLSRADLRRVVRAKEPIVDEWRRDAIHLHGVELARLLRRAA